MSSSVTAPGTGGPVSTFLKHHFRHFNAATLVDAAEAYASHLAGGGKMFVTLAGAMSTAELGISLAEMIRQDKIHDAQRMDNTNANNSLMNFAFSPQSPKRRCVSEKGIIGRSNARLQPAERTNDNRARDDRDAYDHRTS